MRFRRQLHELTPRDFARLYEEHLDAVFNYCLFRVGDRQLAEDLTADTFERAWAHRRRFDPARAGFTTWLFAIARNRIVDNQRQGGRHTTIGFDNGRYVDDRPTPEEQVARAERLDRLRKLVAPLSPEEQELLALKFGAGLTNRRIATLLARSESAVGSAVYRLMQKLRQQWVEISEEKPHEQESS